MLAYILIFLFLFYTGRVNSLNRIEYDIPLKHSDFSIKSVFQRQSAWLMIVRFKHTMNPEPGVEDFVQLKKTLEEDDRCLLARSDNNKRIIILHIYCEKEPVLGATRVHMMRLFGVSNIEGIFIEPDKQYKRNSIGMQTGDVTWGLDRIDACSSRSYDGVYHYENNASSSVVYVIDSGIYAEHPEFEGRAVFLFNAIDDGVDFDCMGHGTHVAGIIGAKTYGVAKAVQIYAVKALDCYGDGYLSDMLSALEFIVTHYRLFIAHTGRRIVINLSLGGPASDAFDSAIRETLRLTNGAIVVAAGNEGRDACAYSPCRLGIDRTILSVGASDSRDRRPTWSNYGACVDVSAPGVNVESTWPNGGSRSLEGTSMATPHVSGLMAILLHAHPTLSVQESNDLLMSRAQRQIIQPLDKGEGSSSLICTFIDTVQTPTTNASVLINEGSDIDSSLLLMTLLLGCLFAGLFFV